MGKRLTQDDYWRRIDPADRARQFMPFAALKGYYDLVEGVGHHPEPKKTINEEQAQELSEKLLALRKGKLAKVTYYDNDCYKTIEGVVVQVDTTFRILHIIKLHIPFDDLWDIEIK